MTNTPESDTMNKAKEFKRQSLTQTIQANRDGWHIVCRDSEGMYTGVYRAASLLNKVLYWQPLPSKPTGLE